METLKIYYSPNQADLTKLENHVTWWLPEQMTNKPTADQLYKVGNSIATCHKMVVYTAQEAISKKLLKANQLLVFKMDNRPRIVYTYMDDGSKKSFWAIPD